MEIFNQNPILCAERQVYNLREWRNIVCESVSVT